MTDPDVFQNMSLSKTSNTNNEITNYSFTLSQKSQILANSILVVHFPPEITPASIICSIKSSSINSSLSCSFKNPNVNVNISAAIPSNEIFTITISGVQNAPSFAQSGNFILTTKLPD